MVKANLSKFTLTKFQEEYILSCHARRICNSVSKYGLRPFPRFFKLVKADLVISYVEEIQEEDILKKRASPRKVEAGRG